MVTEIRPQGIWRWTDAFAEPVPDEHRLHLGEADTPLVPLPHLAHQLDIAAIAVKRDDLSPGGSHKSRSLAYRISLARARGERTVLLSSSGNAAVAASLFCAAGELRLLAFVSPQTSPVKLAGLHRAGTVIIRTPKPRNLARYAGRVFGIPNLTPSLDPLSIEGFKSIGLELTEEAPFATDLFTFVTSGSSLLGIARSGCSLRLHAVQAGASGLTAAALDPRYQDASPPRSTLAGVLGIDDSPRADEVREAVVASGGRGWVQTDPEILSAHRMLNDAGIDTSGEGAACLSAVMRARLEGTIGPDARVVILLTGHASQWHGTDDGGETFDVEGYVELRTLLSERYGLQARERE